MIKLGLIIVILLTLAVSIAPFAADDYILEEKFNKVMPKAEKGEVKAQYAIGEMYEKGRGTVRDLKKAFSWYSKASSAGYSKAEYKLGMAYLNGKGVRKSYSRAFSWFKKSAAKGYVRAQYRLAFLYEKGWGTEQNLNQSLSWYKRALRGGYDTAAAGMKRVATLQQQENLANLQADAIAKAKVLKLEMKKKKPVKPVVKPANKETVKTASLSTLQKVMAGGWMKRNKPVEYLPSASTRCKESNGQVECLSTSHTRNIGVADIEYESKSILYAFKAEGSFKISYRNNVTKVTITDEELLESKREAPVKTGWQVAEHKLTCVFRDDNNLTCKKNNLRSIKLHR